ncbi:MAG: molybdopterin-binding/glycosyltransferase family 2 protein, partial [Alphaproteobacteria bacterium]|nr:molybdopterin-binding/glycosyltransferase family 2 protein [Alphaproteobacteria bacterium]
MIYDDMPLEDAEGAQLAHSQRAGGRKLKKGHRLSASDIEELKAIGVQTVMAFRLEDGDIAEDEAADRICEACLAEHLSKSAAFTGRANLYAEADGVLAYDRSALDALNRIHEAVTIAALEPYAPVVSGQMIATIKIIPFAVPARVLEQVMATLAESGLFDLHPYRPQQVGLIETIMPGAEVNDKAAQKLISITSERLAGIGSQLARADHAPHATADLAAAIEAQLKAGCDMVLIASASATTDRRDVVPSAIVQSGGKIDHFGMPVDPGNLILIGHTGPAPVVGLPGCARSPKINGIDWVLQRLGAGLPCGGNEIMRMGAGGLLKDVGSRPMPRDEAASAKPAAAMAPRIAAIIMAAGTSSRMGENKLLLKLEGEALIHRVAQAAQASKAEPVIVVTGRDAEEIKAELSECAVSFTHNPDFADGMAGSLRTGLSAVPDSCDGAVVLLGDMPFVTAAHVDKLIAAFDEDEGRSIILPTHEGQWGNPIL